MNILITGGAGFIGSNLVRVHLTQNDTVYCIDNLLTGTQKNIDEYRKNKHFRFVDGDICETPLDNLPSFDVIYHLASPASPVQFKKYPLETLRVNSEGTLRLLSFFEKQRRGVFVLASTSEVYGDPLVHPQPETYFGNVNPNGIRSCYDEAKRFAESATLTYFRKYRSDVRIARFFNTYGPRMEKDDGRAVSNFIMQALTNQPLTIYGNGTQTRSFCFVTDLTEALFRLATAKNLKGEVINLGNPNELTIIDLAKMILTLTPSTSVISYHPIGQDDPKRRKPDISKAKQLLQWSPKVSLPDGLRKTIAYFKTAYL
ncbi:GDP-mannose 4,6-dehydratase [Candidatus Roizmanbacteria bacterium]|nr:GDP-mannose 4,6-dehydratase [Candidatus Roizmanbacteria bacterium]